ncbi:hypothetical protein CFHF_18975 [Caulobacter flavus]|uniref:DUF6815 domain-containing protein n=2 Tax=Caulobacter flavus TaxID=1679497 RepID=A0A2N5CPX9_9CAUL|nr:Cj0069 family protein [Caulobacter sp. CCH5-E12]PLR09221.1 hypothetical protein CFHF_18975 [Caulobacter flavus]
MLMIALVSRDDGGRLAAIEAALAAHGFQTRRCRYDEGRDEVFEQELSACDAALVWVNPMQDGQGRRGLDAVLRRAAAAGVQVSTHPDIIDRMGVKAVLATTAGLGWSGDVAAYATAEALTARFPQRLASGPKVLKPNRGNGGVGVWKVEALGEGLVRVMEAADRRTVSDISLEAFLADRLAEFEMVGGFIDQAFEPRLSDGMVRCYLSGALVVGFGWQKVRALLPPEAGSVPPRTYSSAEDVRFQALRTRMEDDWAPGLTQLLGLSERALPVIWDADFLLGPKDDLGRDTYVLCEINVSSVFPVPDEAPAAIAATMKTRLVDRAG